MTLHADDNASAGAKTGNIKSQVFTETSGTQVKWDDFSFTVTITPNSTGIIEISAENPVDVYNIQGNKVRSKATTLSDLPTGVYIVNGRKVIVK